MHKLRDSINLKWSSQVLSSLFRINLRELTLKEFRFKNRVQFIQKKQKARPFSLSWDDDNRCPWLSFFPEMLCCRRTIMLDPQHGGDSACPQFLFLSRFIFHMISKLPPTWEINRLSHLYISKQCLLLFSEWKCNQLHFIFPLLPKPPTFCEFSYLAGSFIFSHLYFPSFA